MNVQVFPKIYSADDYEKEENGKSVAREGDAATELNERADYKCRSTLYSRSLIFLRVFFIANSKVFHISLDTFFWWMAK